MKPYVYLIGWSKENKYYYGVRYAKNCDPKDLWTTYFTSSKHVKRFREDFGEPDIIQVRKTFEDRTKALLWEEKVLSRMNVIGDEKWINKTNNKAICPVAAGVWKGRKRIHSEETKQKLSEYSTGKTRGPHSEETKKKIGLGNKGKIVSEESRKRISESAKKRKRKPHSEETKRKIRESNIRTKALKKMNREGIAA
jgi:hypothetical protein